MDSLQKLLDFLVKLDDRKIHYTLAHHREEAIMVFVSVPGERWEIEFFADLHFEVEVFKSNGAYLEDESALERLFDVYGE
ncbi:hypothetical protein I2I05_10295 [Hymenobacter sp. BT683]|uniref:Uncharacterized protein n=1 Tax=Hymenobacter jeongseonensis TaxID=2791027 RepID=A0ABS0II90_9BACT|nr:hypothetical protein [Hymenobacter jeongseonensis]MBF9237784.1 hypothetical protein [Hymenobacter jeongseonensis]